HDVDFLAERRPHVAVPVDAAVAAQALLDRADSLRLVRELARQRVDRLPLARARVGVDRDERHDIRGDDAAGACARTRGAAARCATSAYTRALRSFGAPAACSASLKAASSTSFAPPRSAETAAGESAITSFPPESWAVSRSGPSRPAALERTARARASAACGS